MKTYKIEVQETLSRIIDVKANTKNEAILKVRQMYKNEEIVLDSSDYQQKLIFFQRTKFLI